MFNVVEKWEMSCPYHYIDFFLAMNELNEIKKSSITWYRKHEYPLSFGILRMGLELGVSNILQIFIYPR